MLKFWPHTSDFVTGQGKAIKAPAKGARIRNGFKGLIT